MQLFADGQSPIIIFCDGACSGNPGKGGWGTIVVRPDGEVRELGGAAAQTTNNQMELMAALKGLDDVQTVGGPVHLFTDSIYVIRGITQWIWGWRQRGWKTAEGKDVANQDLWQQLLAVVTRRGKDGPINWRFVKGHSGIAGNERVDEIAVAFTKGKRIPLYHGPLLGYDVAVHDVPEDKGLPEMKPKAEKKPAAHSYVSVVDGVPERHLSWTDCERRVKGRSGAKFKKAASAADERAILGSWGFKADDLG